jgi:hypothetical protein
MTRENLSTHTHMFSREENQLEEKKYGTVPEQQLLGPEFKPQTTTTKNPSIILKEYITGNCGPEKGKDRL